jgi:Vacuolar sorting-associated protein 13, extended-chorein
MYRKATSTLPVRGMLYMTLQFDSLEGETLRFHGSSRCDFTISGQCNRVVVANSLNFTMTREFVSRHPTQYWNGMIDITAEATTGTWDTELDDEEQRGYFVLKSTAPEDLRFRPAPVTIDASKARSLWLFAISAALRRVRRQSWSWSYFKERKDNRELFLKWYVRHAHYGRPLDKTELTEF